jgi:GNAT superfamily N-acetyltransferase
MGTMEEERFDWIPATPADLATLLPMLGEFYEEEKLAFDPDATTAAVKELLESPSVGRIWFLRLGETVVGYLIAIIGFGVEFGGRYVLLDELFIRPGFRGHGQWRRGFGEVERWAATAGIGFLRLEVNHHNTKAKSLYLGYGFIDDERSILTKWTTLE